MKASLIAAIGFVFLGSVSSYCLGDEDKSLEVRKKEWQSDIDEWTVGSALKRMCFDPIESLKQFHTDCSVNMISDPKNSGALTFKFMRDDKELLSIPGHTKSVFGAWKKRLYFAEYSTASNGTSVAAYDLSDGHKLWKKRLEGVGFVGHFAYSNQVCMRVNEYGKEFSEIVICGNESKGCYIEVLDAETGEQLAHRILADRHLSKREDSHDE